MVQTRHPYDQPEPMDNTLPSHYFVNTESLVRVSVCMLGPNRWSGANFRWVLIHLTFFIFACKPFCKFFVEKWYIDTL